MSHIQCIYVLNIKSKITNSKIYERLLLRCQWCHYVKPINKNPCNYFGFKSEEDKIVFVEIVHNFPLILISGGALQLVSAELTEYNGRAGWILLWLFRVRGGLKWRQVCGTFSCNLNQRFEKHGY